MNPQLSEDIQLYAVFKGTESLVLPLRQGSTALCALTKTRTTLAKDLNCRERQLRYEPEKTGYAKDGQSMAGQLSR